MTTRSEENHKIIQYVLPLIPESMMDFVRQQAVEYAQEKLLNSSARVLCTAALVGTLNTTFDLLIFMNQSRSSVRLARKFIGGMAFSLFAQYLGAFEEGIVNTINKSLDHYESEILPKVKEEKA